MEVYGEYYIFEMRAVDGVNLDGDAFPDWLIVDVDTLEHPVGNYFGTIIFEDRFATGASGEGGQGLAVELDVGEPAWFIGFEEGEEESLHRRKRTAQVSELEAQTRASQTRQQQYGKGPTYQFPIESIVAEVEGDKSSCGL